MKRIFELAADRKGFLIVSGIFSALASIASFIPYIAIYFIVREVISVYPEIAVLERGKLMGYGGLAVAGIALDVICYLAASIFAHLAAFGTQYKLKSEFTRHLAKIPLGFHLTIGSGRFRKVIDEDIEKIETFLAHQYPDIVASMVAPIAMLIILFTFDWRFGLAALAAVILAFITQMMTFGVAGPELMQQMQQASADMNSAAIEYVRGMPVLKGFGQTAGSFKQLYAAIRGYTKFMLTYTYKWENYTSAFQALINNIYLFILPVGILIGKATSDYTSFVLNFVFYLLFTPSIASILNKLMYVSSSSLRISGGVANYDRMINLPVLEQPQHSRNVTGYDVHFSHVSFAYEKEEAKALSDVTFIAKAGEITAVVGPSGSGKSTIANLIPRFWDVAEGSIRLGETDIRDIESNELMNQVGFVFQDVYLFGQSVKENIRMGNENATDQEIIAAAKAARCDEFISRLPNGYDTVVGEKGIHFSGGEKQRISIARAIVKNAPILVLDEATAFADPENEQLIQSALSELMKGKTVIMIAHRLNTIKDADKIIVMREGAVAEQGTHEQLRKQGKLYQRMWENYEKSICWHIGEKEVAKNADA